MNTWVLVLIGIGLFLFGVLLGLLGKKILCSGNLIVTDQDGERHIFLELEDESAVHEHYVMLQVKHKKIPG